MTSARHTAFQPRGNEIIVDADYVVVGSGAGGAAAAVTLARGGATVIVVEAGAWRDPHDYAHSMAAARGVAMASGDTFEWARHGIRLNAIAPGPLPTEGAWARLNPMQEGNDSRYNTRNPMGRVGRPSELANMAAFLMSEEVEYINGEVIAIDGAMGIMGNGTFSHMMSYSEQDWVRIREQIQSTNAADKVKRS
jgi:enoyl-[acyl-carrier-protein] reductase (NADH)